MSLDVFVACAATVLLPSYLPTDVTWKHWDTGSFTAEKPPGEWIVEVWLLDPSESKQFELPVGKKWVVGLSLQGNSDEGADLLQKTVDTIAQNAMALC